MTKTEMLALSAGSTLDEILAVHICEYYEVEEEMPYGYGEDHTYMVWRSKAGYRISERSPPDFSKDLEEAFLLLEKMKKLDSCHILQLTAPGFVEEPLITPSKHWRAGIQSSNGSKYGGSGDTAPMAICKAVLMCGICEERIPIDGSL